MPLQAEPFGPPRLAGERDRLGKERRAPADLSQVTAVVADFG